MWYVAELLEHAVYIVGDSISERIHECKYARNLPVIWWGNNIKSFVIHDDC